MLSLHPRSTRGHSCFVNFSQVWTRYLVEPRVLGLAEALFGPLGTHTRVAATSAVVAEPSGLAHGASRFGVVEGFHADWPWSQSAPGEALLPSVQPQPQGVGAPRLPDVVMDLQTFWLLTDFTDSNGATHVRMLPVSSTSLASQLLAHSFMVTARLLTNCELQTGNCRLA